MRHHVEKATTYSADTARLLEIFGITYRQVCSFHLAFDAPGMVQLNLTCEISEEELRLLVEEFEKNPPVQQHFIGLAHRPTGGTDD